MDDSGEIGRNGKRGAWGRALRPAMPAVISAAAMIFLFAAVMPLAWVAGISWNLYLDRLSPLFEPPVGNGGRLALALGMAVIAALIAGLVALALAKPAPARRRRAPAEEGGLLRRRRADFHPDDPPRPPIRAGRDLPAEGLGPVRAAREEIGAADEAEAEAFEGDMLVLADLAPAEVPAGDEPWLQTAELAGPLLPDPADRSLGAMVARFEAGLTRRRLDSAQAPAVPPPPLAPAPAVAANEDATAADIDFALEAALSTLQRLNRNAAG